MTQTKRVPIQLSTVFIGLMGLLLLLVGCGGGEPAPPPTPTFTPDQALGRIVFQTECGACHSLSPDTVVVGPSMVGIGERAAGRVPEQNAEAYLLTSIMRPDAYLVEGFDNLMPANYGKSLTGEEIDALVAYLLTQ